MDIKKVPKNIILKNGKIIDPFNQNTFIGNLWIQNGRIAGVGDFELPKTSDIHIVNCKNKVITHGFCDLHAHFREPGEEDKALDLGWTPMDAFFYVTDKQLWIQARTTRISLPNFKVKRKHKRYLNTGVTGKHYQDTNPWQKECDEVFKKYCDYREFRNILKLHW